MIKRADIQSPDTHSSFDHPTSRQTRASNPLKSHWVGASAGTGKTKVLIDRVLRLMLPRPGLAADSATAPGRILCLTFTKTAAAEMATRIYQALSDWAIMSDADLNSTLKELMSVTPSTLMMESARRLFARVLEVPGGLKIMTIHAFCQSVLKRFPIESNLPPHFEMLDERTAHEHLQETLKEILHHSRIESNDVLTNALNTLTLFLDAEGMSNLMQKMMAERERLTKIFRENDKNLIDPAPAILCLYKNLNVDPNSREEDLVQTFCRVDEKWESSLRLCLRALLQGSTTDQKKAEIFQRWLECGDKRPLFLEQYRRCFLTDKGHAFEKLATKSAIAVYPDIIEIMSQEVKRLQDFDTKLKSLRLAEINAALLTVTAEVLKRHEKYKRRLGCLDFDDLVIYTASLLSDTSRAQWVLYKLDEGIDHILVDEAQDTSPLQWRIIQSLSAEFFSGAGAHENLNRTLFVVGDEKQSIFSFQGADPAAFSYMRDFFEEKVRVLQEGWEIFLEHSFRSTSAVLEVVDEIFAVDSIRQGVTTDISRSIRHLSYRAGHAGLVEIWPLIEEQKVKRDTSWSLPLINEEEQDASAILAEKIAETIQGWLINGDIILSKNRPIRPSDILILVQSRNRFVNILLRALKARKIPVAGLDRLTLTEEIAVQDLIAFAQFTLQPEDDLTLATLLKSPLIGISEEELYELCQGRQGFLWLRLKQERPRIHEFLMPWISLAGGETPYAFFSSLLHRPCYADKKSGRRAIYGRLGHDVQDPLDEFLGLCLHYEQSHTPSLQGFLSWFLKGEAELKREQDQGGEDQVRIMTVHGAKGLQAPIVFLPDTVKKSHDHPKGRVRLLWPNEKEEVPVWSPRVAFDAPVYTVLRDVAQEKQEEEYRRLLYVALTRAEDRLYVCGWRGMKAASPDCWYHLIASSFPKAVQLQEMVVRGKKYLDPIRILSCAQTSSSPISAEVKRVVRGKTHVLPDFIFKEPAAESFPSHPLSPSRLEEDLSVKGPLAVDLSWRFRRGIIVHHILEILPQLPKTSWDKALSAYLAMRVPEEERSLFAQEVLDVLKNPEFGDIFSRAAKAEVPMVGVVGHHVISAQMDRLLVEQDRVLVVDYKTNRPPPVAIKDIQPVYLRQMALYVALLRQVYPDRPVRAALLWTDTPLLMPLPEDILDKYFP